MDEIIEVEGPEDLTFDRLELCTYRYLQKLAKSMSLPSNVKKIYLIQLIHAKKYCSSKELEDIVDRIKEERKFAKTRKPLNRKKKRVQGTEISSTSNQSPPITRTPQHSDYVIRYPHNARQPMTPHQQRNILRPTITKNAADSDRVLRSCNNRLRPNYRILNINNSVTDVIKTRNALQRSQPMQEKLHELSVALQRQRPVDIGECVEQSRLDYEDFGDQRLREVDFEGLDGIDRHLVPTPKNPIISSARPRERLPNSIYAVKPPEPYQFTPSVGFRRQDGRISKINAVIQKLTERNAQNAMVKSNLQQPFIRCQSTQGCVRRNRVQNSRCHVALQDVLPMSRAIVTRANEETETNISNSSTESARDSSTDIEYVPVGNTESKNNATQTPNRITDVRNFVKENVSKYIKFGKSATNNPYSNTKTPNRYTETTNSYAETPNSYTETPNRYTETRNNTANVSKCTGTRISDTKNKKRNSTAAMRKMETDYPNMSALTDICPENQATDFNLVTPSGNFTVYKEVQAQPVRSQRSYVPNGSLAPSERLPRITDVFSQFTDARYRELTQPLYIQVSDDKLPLPYVNNNTLLENIYNFKSQFIVQPLEPVVTTQQPLDPVATTHQPLAPVATASDTRCVFSNPTISSTVLHPSTVACTAIISHSYERGNEPTRMESTQRLYGARAAEPERTDFRCDEVLISSSSSLGSTSSLLGTNATIPEMVEDALELISQDGDYMERIGMDVRMQCVLCGWAGPKIILDCHLRDEHSSEIAEAAGPSWSTAFSLGALLARDSWASRLVHHAGHMYVVSARYMAGDCFMATLTALDAESDNIPKYSQITVYNRTTGEPHVWEGEIACLPDTMPYNTDSSGLKLDISRLDLLPNSANLKLVNGELVVNSTTKAVVGQPELNNIEIAVNVRIFNK